MKVIKTDETKKMEMISNLRIVQAVSVGIMTLGVSMAAGDLAKMADIAVSSLSITTTLFGLVGTIMSEFMIGRIKKDAK